MEYSLKNIAEIVSGQLLGADAMIHVVFTDSRNLVGLNQKDSLFAALSGKRQSGEHYINDLYQSGFRFFLCENQINFLEGASYILVEDCLKALQIFASFHRANYMLPVIGITGSNGKTIVKEWLFQLLHMQYQIARSPGSYNSQLGVPLSLLLIDKKPNLALIEAGISQPGEMANLQQMIKPDLVILTHLGPAHDEGFESFSQKIKEKLILANEADCLIYCRDNEVVSSEVAIYVKNHFIKTISWSIYGSASVSVSNITKKVDETEIQFIYKSSTFTFSIPFTDDASIENAITCICALIAVERLDAEMFLNFNQLTPITGRLEQKKAINNSLLINDSYNNDLHALNIALKFMDRQNPLLKKTVILSDMLESGVESEKLYTSINDLFCSHKIARLIGIGKIISQHKHCFSEQLEMIFYQSTQDYISNFNSRSVMNEIILLKGARKFHFENIILLLEKQSHQSVMEINLDSIINNLNVYKNQLAKNTKLMVMVKAFSYGSGSYELAKLLQHQRVDYLAVAYADEGVLLRNAGIVLPIMVMNATQESFKLMLDYDLEPTIYSLEMLKSLVDFHQKDQKDYAIHLEFETGMNRLGISEIDLDKILTILDDNEYIKIKSAFTHFASADDPLDDDFTKSQLDIFKEIHRKLSLHLKMHILSHAANTAGISRFNGFNLDMVRLGLGLHGIDPSGELQSQLLPVAKLKSVITQIKKIYKGSSIGYNRKTIAIKDFNMAIVALGYADGLNRLLSNRVGKLYINGVACEIVGNICMDMCMVDIGDMDIQPGAEVIVFENACQLKELAAQCQTISYEILTGISERITRVYIQNQQQ